MMQMCLNVPTRVVQPGDDIQIISVFGLHSVKPISAKAREWFRENTGSIEPQFLVGDDALDFLEDSFAELNLQVIVNPDSDTSEIRRIVSDVLAQVPGSASWRIRQEK
jgi:hypothetical protein